VAILTEGAQAPAILGKPGTRARCIEQLRSCSGRMVHFLTAVAVVRQVENSAFEFVDTTRVAFRVLDDATIERYVGRESPLDCAGGFRSEGLGISLCESIESVDPSALIGLPLIRLCAILRRIGYELP
jgi:septum formation protein